MNGARQHSVASENSRCPEMLRIIAAIGETPLPASRRRASAMRHLYQPGINSGNVKSALAIPSSTLRTRPEKMANSSPFPAAAVRGSLLSCETLQSLAHSVPRRYSVTALHPPKYPRDGAQILETPTLSSARWARADASRIQFLYRRGLLKVFQHVGILGNVAAVGTVSFLRHLVHRLFPARLILRRNRLLPWTRQRFQAGRNHQLQVPLRQHRIRILPVENFSLLGDANAPGKGSFWLRQDCRWVGPPPRPTVPPRP